MHRRFLLTLPLLAALPLSMPLPVRSSSRVSELRAGVGPEQAARLGRRLGVPVRSVQAGRVAALNAGHLEIALLDDDELAAARHCMRERLLVLPGRIAGQTPVTRAALPAGLRRELAAALA
jgi:hypothetical protein